MSRPFFAGLLAPVRRLASRRGGLPLLVLLVTAGLIGLLAVSRPRLVPEMHAERVWPVQSVAVRRQDIQPELVVFGEVVAGPIVRIGERFREGGVVAAGELLVEIDPFHYRTTLAERRAQLREAEVHLDQLQRDERRIVALHAEGSVSARDRDNAELAARQQEAVVEQRRIDVERAERELADTRLTAPYGGVLGNVSGDLGKRLGANDKVADLTDTGQLEVRFSLSNAEYGRLSADGEVLIGRAVTVAWQVGEQTRRYPARIARTGAEIISTTGGIDVYAVLDAGVQSDLRPGAFVSVVVPDRRYEAVYVAPESALHGDDLVYIIAGERLTARRIALLGHAGSDMIFRAAGEPALADGDRVVVTPLREAGVGVKVIDRPAGD